MKKKYLFLALVSTSPSAVLAQNQTPGAAEAVRDSTAKHSIAANGSKNAEAIPYGVILDSAFNRLARRQQKDGSAFGQELSARFGALDSDVETISRLTAQQEQFSADVHNEEARQIDEACYRLFATPVEVLNAREVAETFEQIERNVWNAFEAHYKAGVDALSPAVRGSFTSYVDTEVRGSLSWGTVDTVAVAAEVPDAFLSTRRDACEKFVQMPSDKKSWTRKVTPQGIEISPEQLERR